MEASGCVKQRDTFLSDVHVGQRTADATGGNVSVGYLPITGYQISLGVHGGLR